MSPPLPADACQALFESLDGLHWFRNVQVVGIGLDAVLEVLALDMAEAERVVQGMGGRWQGYRVRARRYE